MQVCNSIQSTINFSKDRYYFYCCAGLGDTLITLSIHDKLEEKYGDSIVYLLKKTHSFIAEMYGVENYIELSNKEIMRFVEKSLFRTPRKGSVYAAHPCLHPELFYFFQPIKDQFSTKKFLPWLYEFFDLNFDYNVKLPLKYPTMDEGLRKRIEKIGPLDRVALISPEATSMTKISGNFWEDLVKELKDRGLYPISNVIDSRNTIKGSKYIPLTSKEAFIVGCNVKEVHSVRSGLCDLLFERGKDLYVYYPTHRAYHLYCMNDMFSREDINERIILD